VKTTAPLKNFFSFLTAPQKAVTVNSTLEPEFSTGQILNFEERDIELPSQFWTYKINHFHFFSFYDPTKYLFPLA
jgi:hypothetical protein